MYTINYTYWSLTVPYTVHLLLLLSFVTIVLFNGNQGTYLLHICLFVVYSLMYTSVYSVMYTQVYSRLYACVRSHKVKTER